MFLRSLLCLSSSRLCLGLALVVSAFIITACGSGPITPGVTRENANRCKKGMAEWQVIEYLGEPTETVDAVANVFGSGDDVLKAMYFTEAENTVSMAFLNDELISSAWNATVLVTPSKDVEQKVFAAIKAKRQEAYADQRRSRSTASDVYQSSVVPADVPPQEESISTGQQNDAPLRDESSTANPSIDTATQ